MTVESLKETSDDRLSRINLGRKSYEMFERETRVNRGYSVFIKFIRRFFVFLALAFIVLVALWIYFWDQKQTPVTQAPITKTEAEAALVSPKFTGVDNERRPFTVIADKAVRSTRNKDRIDMQSPAGNLLMDDNQKLSVKSDQGQFYQETSVLSLQDNVEVDLEGEMIFNLEDAIVDLDVSTAKTKNAVHGKGPHGAVSGAGLIIEDAGNSVLFTGPASLRLNAKPALEPEAEQQQDNAP